MIFNSKKLTSLFFITFSLSMGVAYSKTPVDNGGQKISTEASSTANQQMDLNKVSEAFGHLIGKNLESLGYDFNMGQVIKGMEDAIAGKESPMNETECVQAIANIQEEAFQALAQKNQQAAEAFMQQQARRKDVVTLEKNRLHYTIDKTGHGKTVEAHHSPLIRYSGRFLDGKVFGESNEDELISLDETIPGFSQGIIGMKEGEKRTLYIHPKLGYGTSGYLPPNSLLVFEIEIVKAHAPVESEEAISSLPTDGTQEIATPQELEKNSLR